MLQFSSDSDSYLPRDRIKVHRLRSQSHKTASPPYSPPTSISDTNHKSRLTPELLVHWLWTGGSHNCLLRSSQLAGAAHRTQQNIYILGHWFLGKDIAQEEPNRRDAEGKVYEKGKYKTSMFSLSIHSPSTSTCSPAQELATTVGFFYGGFIM